METEDRLDLEYALKNKLTDLNVARDQRMAALAEAKAAAEKARLIAQAAARKEREEKLRTMLAKNPDRFVVSIDGQLVKGKKAETASFVCPKCGAELPQVLETLREVMEATFPRLAAGDFSNSNGQPRAVANEYTCGKCSQHLLYRTIAVPY